MTGRIECETAAQCREIAAVMESTIEPLVFGTVILVVFAVFGHAIYRQIKRQKASTD